MNPIIRYGIVACALTALVLFGLGYRSDTVVLADVIEAVAKHKTARFTKQFVRKGGQTFSEKGILTMDGVHERLERPNGYLITNYLQRKWLFINSKQQTATVELLPKRYPQAFPDILNRYRNDKRTKASQEKRDGRNVLVYRLDKEKGEFRVTIWIDAKTKLPLRLETSIGKPNPPLGVTKTVWTHFEWDPQIDDQDKFFSVQPPEGYKLNTLDIRSFIEPDSTESKKP